MFHVIAVSLGSAGFIGFLSINAKSIPLYVLCELISFAIAFCVTFFYGKAHRNLIDPVTEAEADAEAKAVEVQAEATAAEPAGAVKSEEVLSPVDGKVEDLSKVKDEVFSQKMMGDGAAVVPSDGTIYSPVDGKITVAYATKHAYGITSDDGAEILIHVGLDTVNLKGEHFTSAVEQGQTVKRGDGWGRLTSRLLKRLATILR